MAAKPRIKVPKTASAGDVIKIKTLISHKMESGQRKDSKTGEVIPRKILNRFDCEFNGKSVFSCDIQPGISANPFIEFHARVNEAGTFKFSWTDDDGSVITSEKSIELG